MKLLEEVSEPRPNMLTTALRWQNLLDSGGQRGAAGKAGQAGVRAGCWGEEGVLGPSAPSSKMGLLLTFYLFYSVGQEACPAQMWTDRSWEAPDWPSSFPVQPLWKE